MVRPGMLVVGASLLVSMHANADHRPLEPLSAAHVASDMSDADVLAERHLALYRVARAAVLGLRDEAPPGDSTPVGVRTSATASLPLPREPQRPHTATSAQ